MLVGALALAIAPNLTNFRTVGKLIVATSVDRSPQAAFRPELL
jgi:hypothetical protein